MTRHSVILSCYNGEAFIAEAIKSVLCQLTECDELIVVDDASTDSTGLCVEAFSDSRIRLIVRASNGGPAEGRNVGLSLFQGQFVSFIDHDDLWPTGRIEDLERLLAANPSLQCIYGRVENFFNTSELSECYKMPEVQHALLVGSTTLSRDLVEKVGLFDTTLTCGEFVDFMARAKLVNSDWLASNEIYLKRRIHGDNYTLSHARDSSGYLRMARKHIAMKRKANCE